MKKYDAYNFLEDIENVDEISNKDVLDYQLNTGLITEEEYNERKNEVVDEEVESYSHSSNRSDTARTAAYTAANTVAIAHR
jgi:hypothetical protein